jgi:methylthioribulose 1-phosphate dehydratase/enolase-phosphatase E1
MLVAIKGEESGKRKLHDAFTVDGDDTEVRNLVCELCRQFFHMGWVTGTGGSISIRKDEKIYMTPSGVPKERILPEELFVVDGSGNILLSPSACSGASVPKLSDCAPLFLHAFRKRNAGAVIHSHGISVNIVTSLCEGKNEFMISHQEMIKGIAGYGYHDQLIIPIIENTAWEHELADSLGEAIDRYPKSCAVLVRRHGIYVWGSNWQAAKRHAECLHYLFDVAIQMHHKLGQNFYSPPIEYRVPPRLNFKFLIVDIEGTTTPLSFVRDILFPYARQHVANFLQENYKRKEILEVYLELTKEMLADERSNVGNVPVISGEALAVLTREDLSSELFSAILDSDDSVVVAEAVLKYISWNMDGDRKVSSLKQLQGFIWEDGYRSGKIHGLIFDDVPRAFARLRTAGIKIYVYSSGSRHAQNMLFKYSNHGDLRPFISGYFDTRVGPKSNPDSYRDIALTVGTDVSSDALFITDSVNEAHAAAAAGLQVLLSDRPGNHHWSEPMNGQFDIVPNFDGF